MVAGDTPDLVRGLPASMSNLYHDTSRTHDEYQYRIKDKELLEAAKNNEMTRARLMLDDRADVNVADMGGYSAVWFAAAAGHAGVVRLLLGRGAALPEEASEDGRMLSLYCTHGRHAEVQALLRESWRRAAELSPPSAQR